MMIRVIRYPRITILIFAPPAMAGALNHWDCFVRPCAVDVRDIASEPQRIPISNRHIPVATASASTMGDTGMVYPTWRVVR